MSGVASVNISVYFLIHSLHWYGACDLHYLAPYDGQMFGLGSVGRFENLGKMSACVNDVYSHAREQLTFNSGSVVIVFIISYSHVVYCRDFTDLLIHSAFLNSNLRSLEVPVFEAS